MSRCSGHQSRFLCPRVPCGDRAFARALSSVFASMFLSDRVCNFLPWSAPAPSCRRCWRLRQWRSAPSGNARRFQRLARVCRRVLWRIRWTLVWKISNIRSSRIVLSSRSVYLIGMITLRQLRYLSALAKHGHFGRAAEACAVTQPALSMQIRDLERTLGVAVVERRPGDVMLTDVGREIARRGRGRADGLARSGRFRPPSQRPADGTADARGDSVAGALSAAADSSALQARFPELQLELRETQTRQLVEDIKSGALDAAMLALPVAEPDIDTHRAVRGSVPAGGAGQRSAPARHARVAAEDIDQGRLILLEDGHCLRDQALAFCATATRGRSTAPAARCSAPAA